MVTKTFLAAAGAGLAAVTLWSARPPAPEPAPIRALAERQDWRAEIAAAQAETQGAADVDCDHTVSLSRVHNVSRDEHGRIIAAAIRGDPGPAPAPYETPTS